MNMQKSRNHCIHNRFRLKAAAVAMMAVYGSAAMASDGPSMRQLFTAPAGYSAITSMQTFNGSLYIGVDSKLFRVTDPGCGFQEEVTPDPSGLSYDSLVEFKGALYASGPAGSVYLSSDGQQWQQVRYASFYPRALGSEMLEFNGKLYLVVDSAIYRSGDGSNWAHMTGNEVSSFPTDLQDVQMTVFEGILYAGGYRLADGGHQIWRSGDGRHWNLDDSQSSGYGLADLKSFNNHAYGVEHGHTRLHRRNSDNAYTVTPIRDGNSLFIGEQERNPASPAPMATWSFTEDNWYPLEVSAFNGRTDAGELAEHNGKLYLSAYTNDPGSTPFLYSSSDGQNWQAVGDTSLGLSGPVDAGALASWNSRLYVGVSSNGGSAAVYEYLIQGQQPSQCEITAAELTIPSDPWWGW